MKITKKQIIGAVIAAASAFLLAWQASNGNWIAAAIAALGVLGGLFPVSLMKPQALIPIAFMLCAACGPTTWQEAVLRTADIVRAATVKTIPDLMAKQARKEAAACDAKHAKGSAEWKACVKPIVDRLRTWQDKARPALRATVKALLALYDEFKDLKPRPAPVRPAGSQPPAAPRPARASP